MSSDRKGKPCDQVTSSVPNSAAPQFSTSTSALSDNTIIHDPPYNGVDQTGQGLLDQQNIYDGFNAIDSAHYEDFEQLFAPTDEFDRQWCQVGNHFQDSIADVPRPYDPLNVHTEYGTQENLEYNATNVDHQSANIHGQTDRQDDESDNKCLTQYSLDIDQQSSSRRRQQSSTETVPSDETNTRIQPQSDIGLAASPHKPKRPALVALTSSGGYSATSTTSSCSSHVQTTPDTVIASPSPVLKLRRGRPPLYPPLPTYELRQQSTIPEAPSPGEPSRSSNPTPLSLVSSSQSGSATAPQPRRGRPPLYGRTPSTPTSSQEITREQNRLAARRFRARQETYMATLNAQVEDLELKNKDLKDEVARLREERLELRDGMLKHGQCGCSVMETYLDGETRRLKKSKEDSKDTQDDAVVEGEGKDEDKQEDF